MIDGCLKGRFLVFLVLVGCLGVTLQNAGRSSSTEATWEPFRCVQTSLAGAPTSPTEAAGEAPSCDNDSSADSVFVAHGLFDTVLPQERRLLAACCTALPEGFPAEIDRPPIASA